MAKKGDVFRFADNDYLIQNIEETVVRVTKIVNGKPQKGRPSKMNRELVEKLVGERLDTTPVVPEPDSVIPSPTPPITELTSAQVEKKKRDLKGILSTLNKNNKDNGAPSLPSDDFSSGDEDELDVEEEENEELSTLFDEN